MKYPKEVQACVNVLNEYKENKDLKSFNIIHMYPKKIAYPNGYWDSKFFKLIAYNEELMEFRSFGKHDGLDICDNVPVDIIRIFADGSTLVRFKKYVATNDWKNAGIHVYKKED